MFVYVVNQDGKPLMPAKRFGKVRRLLRDGMAKVIHKNPFTIQLTYKTGDIVQEICAANMRRINDGNVNQRIFSQP